jgi:diguanylate cyclase (GGDEF)-like protein
VSPPTATAAEGPGTVAPAFGARETSPATMGALLNYLRAQGGEDAVLATLDQAGVRASAQELTDSAHWTSYDTRIRLFAAATAVLEDPTTMFHVGAAALTSGLAPSVVLVLRAMGSPRQVFRRLPSAVPKFTTTSTMEVVEVGATSATMSYRLHAGYAHSRLDCQYAQGLLTLIPSVFGLRAARIVHEECESDGHPACIYHLTWDPRSRLPWRRGRQADTDLELTALRGQLQGLQSAATDLVSTDDLDTALRRIVTRAAEAVLAPAYLLAVRPPGGGPALVQSAGLPCEEARRRAEVLLDGGDLGREAVVVEIVSARRSHGFLAALYGPGHRSLGGERALLAAYAGYAAAAMDLLMALEESRVQANRSTALLGLAHELAGAADAAGVAAVVAEALPRVVGCSSASVMLWEPDSGLLRVCAVAGLDRARRELFLSTTLAAGTTPEVDGLVSDRTPRILTGQDSSPVLRELLGALQLSDVVAVPLVAGGALLGVATASWELGEAPTRLDGDVLARLRGVGDQAATALERARLIEEVRHQASHDPLTGLPNRALFSRRLSEHLADAGPHAPLAVLFCDLDRFKEVNDSLGHAAGDELLRQVAERLRASVRPGDTVGRLSGDEFALVLPEVVDRADAERLADRVAGCFDDPFRLGGREVTVQASVGVAVHLAAVAEDRGEDLLRAADEAMYRVKERRRGPADDRRGRN